MKALVKTRTLRVDVDASPIYELLLQLTVFNGFENLDSYDVGREWADRQRQQCSPQLLRAIDRLGGPSSNLDQLIGLQWSQPSASVPAFLQRLEQLAPIDVKLHLVGFYGDVFNERTEATVMAAVSGSRKARLAAARALTLKMPERLGATADLLATPAEELKELAWEVISEWYQRIFASEEATARTVLAADARAKRALLGTDPERLVLIATGINYRKQDRFNRCLLIPTLIMRPWVAVLNYKRLCIYAYPVPDDPTSPETARRGVARIYQALGDEQRLRILKLLTGDELTLDQLCERLELPPATVRAHIAVLRAGRIVQINCMGEEMTYQLRGDIMRAIAQPLQAYLNLAPSLS
jgi:DNA-binding transcriptional ArsR family regulator